MIIKFLLIITFLINQLKTVIILPFERVHYRELTEENIMEELINNYIQVPFYIGEPLQKIPMILKMEQFPTFLTSEEYNKNIIKFDEKKSSTFKMINGHKGHYDTFDFTEGILSNDSLDFGKDQKKMKNFTFVLAKNLTYQSQNFSGEIGLKLISNSHSMPYSSSFINQLKSKDIIESYPFAIRYLSDDKGEFIIGNYLHNYDKNYVEDEFLFAKIGVKNQPNQWKIDYRYCFVNDNELNEKEKEITFLYEYGLIEGSYEYFLKINELFFQYYIDKGICVLKFFGYWRNIYIVCKDSINFKKFPDIVFVKDGLNYNFTLGYQDLFFKFKDKYYFLVISHKNTQNWVFGKPFFKKYLIFFDKDRRIFGVYPNIKQSYNFPIAWVLVIILSVALFISIVYMKYYLKSNRRKIKANELEEYYEYIPEQKNNIQVKNKLFSFSN